MTVFAQVGTAFQQIGGSCPDGWLPMQEQRPDGEGWLASATGTWMLDVETMLREIDSASDLARQLVAGDPLRAIEHERAAMEAEQFKEAGYPENAVPRSVSAGALPGQSTQQAADQILSEAAQFTESLYRIRETRLQAKAEIRVLMAENDTEAALSRTALALVAIDAIVQDVAYVD